MTREAYPRTSGGVLPEKERHPNIGAVQRCSKPTVFSPSVVPLVDIRVWRVEAFTSRATCAAYRIWRETRPQISTACLVQNLLDLSTLNQFRPGVRAWQNRAEENDAWQHEIGIPPQRVPYRERTEAMPDRP